MKTGGSKLENLFKDIRVIDFTWMGVGALITKYLGECGAEIIKIESENRPDPIRLVPPFKDNIAHMERSCLYAKYNTCKYSFRLNLSHPKGVEVARRLVAKADIVAESFTPGTMERLGLSYETLKEVNPRIIMISTSMQGQTGPHATSPGTGMTLTSLAGFHYITGWPDRVPSGVYGPYTDYVAPLFGASALHAALDYRQRTGKGQHLDLSQFEASLQFLAPLLLDYEVNGHIAERMGNQSPYVAPHGVYRCSGEDRWCAIAVFSDEQWNGFCQAIGNPPWARSSRFATLMGRLKNSDELDRLVESWTVQYSAEEVMKRLQKMGVPAGVLETGEDLWNDSNLNYHHAFFELNHPEAPCVVLRRPVDLSKVHYKVTRPPLLGEHLEYVCKQVLELSDEEFVELLTGGIFE